MPFQPVGDVLGIGALQDAHIIRVHQPWNLQPARTGQAVSAPGAESFKALQDVFLNRFVLFLRNRHKLFGHGDGLVDLLNRTESNQRGGDIRIGQNKPQRRMRHIGVASTADKIKPLRVLRNQSAVERVHGDDAHPVPGRGGDDLLAERKVHRVIAQCHAFEESFGKHRIRFAMRHVCGADDMLDQSFIAGFEQRIDRTALFAAFPVRRRFNAPDIKKVNAVESQPFQRALQ